MPRSFRFHTSLLPLLIMAGTTCARAADCHLRIDANDQMQFSQHQLEVPAACAEIEVTLNHTGKLPAATMGHNWVLTRSKDATAVATLGAGAGAQHNYLPVNDARIIAATRLIGGGESASVKFSTAGMKAGEDYTFFCSAPGHIAMMKGRFQFKP